MKIIEALKEIPLLEKRIQKTISQIGQYSAFVDNGANELPFRTENEQEKEVQALLQSCNDLVKRCAYIRKSLAVTNAQVEVTIGDETRSIAEWIYYRAEGMDYRIRAQQSLSDDTAKRLISQTAFNPEDGIKVVRFYDEKKRNMEIERLEEIKGQIDAKLEMVNATTDLIE